MGNKIAAFSVPFCRVQTHLQLLFFWGIVTFVEILEFVAIETSTGTEKY
jgi:hypothetical protein